MLGVVEVDVHGDRQDGHHQNDEHVGVAEEHGEHTHTLNSSQGTGAVGSPGQKEEGDQIGGHVVHHEGEQGLVGLPLGLEQGGNDTPGRAREECGDQHEEDEAPVGHLAAQVEQASGSSQTAHQHLALGTDVPELHAEGGGDGERDTEEDGHVLDQLPDLTAGAEGAAEHGDVHINGVALHQKEGDDTADQEGRQNGDDTDHPGFPQGDGGSLDDMEQGLTDLGGALLRRLSHLRFPPFLRWYRRRGCCPS